MLPFTLEMQPAGQFGGIQQYIYWYPTANEARFADDCWTDFYRRGSVLNLNGVGDGAWGEQ